MTDTTPPIHPMEREQLHDATTLIVTVTSDESFHDTVTDHIETLDRGDTVDSPPTLSFQSYDDLMATLTPRVLDLIAAIRRHEPPSINETARLVDRDVKNVHDELTRLAQLGLILYEEDGQRKRPIVWFDKLHITLPFTPHTSDTPTATP